MLRLHSYTIRVLFPYELTIRRSVTIAVEECVDYSKCVIMIKETGRMEASGSSPLMLNNGSIG